MAFPEHIFKAYDIRGLVDSELSPELAYAVGGAFVHFLKESGQNFDGKYLVVGQDMRPTSAPFAKEVIRAITEQGVSVVEIGQCTTPLFNFASAHYDEHVGGIMVTASHNPTEYNGFKMTLGSGMPIGQGTGMEEIQHLAMEGLFEKAEIPGEVIQKEVLGDYKEKIFSIIDPSEIKPFKVVVDAGNGMGKATFPDILQDVPIDIEYLYLEPDGTFPNHEANPLKTETLKDLQAKVKEIGADFGFALDGDADRIGLVDEKGDVVEASFVGALLGLEVLKKHPGGKMFYDLRSSIMVREVWEAAGGVVDMCMVGHANIKKLLKDNNGIFASELSLHLYYGDMYFVESTDLSLLLVLALLSREGKTLSELVQPLQKYAHSGEMNFEVENNNIVIAKIEEIYKDSASKRSHMDGLWMNFDWGWFSVRKSNTEPVLRLNLEARDENIMRLKLKEVKEIISSGTN